MQMAIALLEQLDSYISDDDSNDEDFCVDNINLQKASSSKSSDSKAGDHCINVISPIRKQDFIVDMGGCKDKEKNVPNRF